MASAEAISKTAPTSSKPNTPPQTPTQDVGPTFSSHHIQQFLDILKRLVPTMQEASNLIEIKEDNGNEKKARIRASKLEFKAVNETWNKAAYKYTIAESQEISTKEDDKWEEYIFIARKKFDRENKYYTEYLDIKSEGLQAILCEVLKDVNGVSLREDKPSVHPALLLNYLPQLEAYQADHSLDSTHIRHLGLLIQYLNDHYNVTLKRFNALLKGDEISFDLLWILFQPNTVVYTTCPGFDQPRCLKFDFGQKEQSSQGECFFKLDCRYLDYDGKVFGEVETSLTIPEFRGVKKINTLDIFPLQYHEQAERLKDALIARGRKFISLIGMHHRNYKGITFIKKKGKYNKVYVESRVMIDAGEFKQVNPNYSSSHISSRADLFEEPFLYGCILGWDSPSNDSEAIKTNGIAPNEMKEEDLLLCSPTVLGFSFSNKLWVEFAVAHVKDIIWDPSPFQCLVLPDEQKNIIRALAESQKIETDKPFDDFVKGKGQGLIILLHGPAGVGKTLTAEGISEFLKRPLYAVCAGDLGVDSSRLETKLSNILHLARHWNAILLLDEADVFLEERSLHDTNRNALVSVFLCQVEYFQGTIFLTTNRVKTFDEAFQSRIHFALRYGKLSKLARGKVWAAFLQRSGMSRVKPNEVEKLIEKDINGRQIKNAIQTALALAMNKGEDMSYKHLETVINATADFDRDFKGSGYIENMRSYT